MTSATIKARAAQVERFVDDSMCHSVLECAHSSEGTPSPERPTVAQCFLFVAPWN